MKAMRVKSGHTDAKGIILLPQETQKPPEALQQIILPWIKGTLEGIAGRFREFPTVLAFLKILQSLCSVIIQDMVCLVIAGHTYSLFQQTVFQSYDFKCFLFRYQHILINHMI